MGGFIPGSRSQFFRVFVVSRFRDPYEWSWNGDQFDHESPKRKIHRKNRTFCYQAELECE